MMVQGAPKVIFNDAQFQQLRSLEPDQRSEILYRVFAAMDRMLDMGGPYAKQALLFFDEMDKAIAIVERRQQDDENRLLRPSPS